MTGLLRNLSLKSRVVLLVAVLLIAGIWGLATRVSAFLQSDIEQVLYDQLSTTVRYVATDLDNSIRLRVAMLNEIAASITPEELADPAKIRKALERRPVSSDIFPLGLIVANKEGDYIADYPVVAGRLGAKLTDTRFLREILDGASQAIGGPVIGRTAKQALFRIAVPLRDASGRAAGLLFGAVLSSQPTLFGGLEQSRIGNTGYFLLMSPGDKLVVAASDPKRVMEPLPAKGVNPLLDRRIEQGFEGPGRTISSKGVDVLTLSRNLRTTGWVLLAAIPAEEAFAPIAALKRQIYLTALLLSLALVVILYVLLARQLAPLKAASAAMRRMTDGTDPLAPIPIARKDEIGDLIGNFNRLAGERAGMDASLRKEIAERKHAQEELGFALRRLQALSAHISRTLDTERRKVAFELHEELGQDLASLKLQLQILEAQCLGAEMQLRLEDARMIAEIMLDRVREMALELYPSQLDDFGLSAALRHYCAEQGEKAGWIMHVEAPAGRERAEREVELACFRVVQEALANVASHARATEVWVSLRQSADQLELRLRDNGVGFDAVAIHHASGARNLGLMEMEERVGQAGGHIEIHSSPGEGTEIYVRFLWQRNLFQPGAPAPGAAAA